ncbi:glycolipid anchored surface protein GAS1, partial [Corynespora cassiicola Philippines]
FLAALAATVFADLPTISTKGSKLFTSDGNQFFVKGIAYQLTGDDPLVDTKQCALDAALMKSMGVNSIRIYHVNPNATHDECMKTLADNGIYLWLDLDTFDTAIFQLEPKWTQGQLDRFAGVMDAFQKYSNLAGFFVGNEVLTSGTGSYSAPFVKAAARDLKAYRDTKGYRKIPVGYAAADIGSLRPMLQNYLACGDKPEDAIDFFALNAYSWCGQSNYQQSGYISLVENAKAYNVPIFLSETGCNVPTPRNFDDQDAIFGPEMSAVWSGAIIYEWIQEVNNYGLIKYGEHVDPASPGAPPDGYTRSGTPTPILPDFTNLSSKWKTLNPTGVKEAEYNPKLTPVPCPTFMPTVWKVDPSKPLPTLG